MKSGDKRNREETTTKKSPKKSRTVEKDEDVDPSDLVTTPEEKKIDNLTWIVRAYENNAHHNIIDRIKDEMRQNNICRVCYADITECKHCQDCDEETCKICKHCNEPDCSHKHFPADNWLTAQILQGKTCVVLQHRLKIDLQNLDHWSKQAEECAKHIEIAKKKFEAKYGYKPKDN